MFEITKRIVFSAAHSLNLDYPSKCAEMHGHNWAVYITCQAEELDKNGMVYDFTKLKSFVMDLFDHRNLNVAFKENPTAENIAAFIAKAVGPKCIKVRIIESEGNEACYIR